MYVSPITGSTRITGNRQNTHTINFKKSSLSTKLDKLDKDFLQFINSKKGSRFLNIVLVATLSLFGLQVKTIADEITQDCVQMTPLIKDFDTQEGALNYSIGQITSYLNTNTPREYSVHINNKKHNIISEFLGNDSTVVNFAPAKQLYNWATTSDYSFTSLHGHPAYSNGATSSFSFQDFRTFVNKDNCSATYVINKDGKYCRLEKTPEYKEISDATLDELELEYEKAIYYSRDIEKTIYNKKGEVVFNIVDYPGIHNFWDDIANRYGMKYVTTFGTYGLYNDIYTNGYHEAFANRYEVI